MYDVKPEVLRQPDIGLRTMASAEFSLVREKILEHRLLSDLALVMLGRGVEMDVLRSEFDAHGHEVVLEAAGVMRHVQLKATVHDGKGSAVIINSKLSSKPSGCVIWSTYDRETLDITSYRWLGAPPGQPLTSLGERLARRVRGNAQGFKAQMPGHRVVAKGRFERLLVSIGVQTGPLLGRDRRRKGTLTQF